MFLKSREEEAGIKSVLYAPTWEGFTEVANSSSVRELGLNIMQSLLQKPGVNAVFKPHTFTGRRCKKTKTELKRIIDFCNKNGIAVLGTDDSLHDAMNASNLLITDISSVLSEYLITEKPIVLCDPFSKPIDELHEQYPSSRAAYIFRPGEDLLQLLESVETNDDLREQRESVRTYALGSYPNGAFSEFSSQLARVLNQ